MGAAPVRGNVRQSRFHFVELAEPADDSIRENRVIVAVAREQRFSHPVFEAVLVIDSVPNVKEP